MPDSKPKYRNQTFLETKIYLFTQTWCIKCGSMPNGAVSLWKGKSNIRVAVPSPEDKGFRLKCYRFFIKHILKGENSHLKWW